MGERRAQERHPGRMTRAALLIFLIAWTAQAGAQSFPSRPIHFAVAFAPGGIADTIARGVGQKMSERIGQPVVVETKSGAGGMVGAKYVAAAAPDGYTVLVTTTALAINANAPQGVNPLTELTPVAIAASTPTIFAVNGNVAAKDLMDFVRNVKGGRFSFASAGIGSAEHLAGEYLFRSVQGLEATHVPFQGGAPVNTAIVSQQVDVASTTLPTALAFVKQQSMRVLAVASHARMPLLPNVPTLGESGFPDFENASWIAFFAPGAPGAKRRDQPRAGASRSARSTERHRSRTAHAGPAAIRAIHEGGGRELGARHQGHGHHAALRSQFQK